MKLRKRKNQKTYTPKIKIPVKFPGQKYAWLSMKAQISTILRNYKFSTDLTMDDMQLDVDLLIRNISGYKVKLHRRTEKL